MGCYFGLSNEREYIMQELNHYGDPISLKYAAEAPIKVLYARLEQAKTTFRALATQLINIRAVKGQRMRLPTIVDTQALEDESQEEGSTHYNVAHTTSLL